MPAVFVGSVEQIAADMRERRERFGFSYYVITDSQFEQVAPLLEHLSC